MKNKLIRFISACLSALTVAAATSSCAFVMTDPFQKDDTTTANTTQGQTQVDYGSIWKAIAEDYRLHYSSQPVTDNLAFKPLPLTFLKDEGLVYTNDKGEWAVNNDKYKYRFTTIGYVDETTKANDVYLLLQYSNKNPIENGDNSEVWLATWQLKYTLDDADYDTFLRLNGDYRMAMFIQEMDMQYEPEVIFKSVVSYDLVSMGSHLRNAGWSNDQFPNILVANVNYEERIVTFGSKYDKGFKYYDVDMKKSLAWEACLDKFGITEDEREKLINMETKATPVGQCLTTFNIRGLRAGYSNDQAKEAYNNSDRVQTLKAINVNGQKRLYNIFEK